MQFFRYVLAGGVTAALELALFLIMLKLGLWYVWANAVAFGVAVVFGFFVQKYFTFRNRKPQHVQQAIKFLMVIGIGFLLTNVYLWLFISVLSLSPWLAKCLQLVLVMFSNYAGQKWFTFRDNVRSLTVPS